MDNKRNGLGKNKGTFKLEVNDIVYLKEGIYPVDEIKRIEIRKIYPKIKTHRDGILTLEFQGKDIVEFQVELEFLERNTEDRNAPYKKATHKLKMALDEQSIFSPEIFEDNNVLNISRSGPYTVIAIGSFNKKNKGMNLTTTKYGIYENKVKQFGFFVLIAEYKTQIYSWMPGCLIEKIKKIEKMIDDD